MMKKLFVGIIFLLVTIPCSRAGVYENIAYKLSSQLHIVQGKVLKTELKKKIVVLNKGYADGLYKNSIVYIYKNRGKLMLFNDNSSVTLKKGVAYAYVSKLMPHKAYAVITGGLEKQKDYLIGLGIIPWGEKELIGTPKANENFIAGKKEYRIAIITRNPVIYSSLKGALEKTGRFYVINPDTIAIAITNKRIHSLGEKSSIKQLADAINADLVMLVSTRRYETMHCKIYNGYAAKVITSFNEQIDKKSRSVLVNNENSTTIPAKNMVASTLRLSPKLTFWEQLLNKVGLYSPYSGLDMSSAQYRITLFRSIGYGTTAFYVADVNNDQTKDIFVAQGSRVKIYNFDFDSFIKKGSFSYGYNIFNIDSATINGKTLIAISNFNRFGELDSAIGYLDKHYKFHIIKEGIPYHVRFYDKFSSPKLLVQKAAVFKPFIGPVYVMNIQSGSIKKLNLPVKPEDLYTFERIDGYIAYLSKSGQLCLYDTDSGKTLQRTAYTFGGGERPIQRYNFEQNNQESIQEVEAKNNVYIPKGIVFFKGKNGDIYALGGVNYISRNITINKQHYGGYSLKLLRFASDKFKLVWSSGDVRGRVVGFGKIDDYIVSVIGLPAGFFDRFIRGILEIDRLSAGQIER